MITMKSLGLTEADLVIQTGITHASKIGSPSTIAVVDVGGTIVAQARMDGAALSSVALAFGSIVDVITGKSSLFRNVITPDLSEGVREQSLEVWKRKTTDGLDKRAELVQRSYDLKPETLGGSR